MWKTGTLTPSRGYPDTATPPLLNENSALLKLRLLAVLIYCRRRGTEKVSWLKKVIWSLSRRGVAIQGRRVSK
jgi:hypothetical protein